MRIINILGMIGIVSGLAMFGPQITEGSNGYNEFLGTAGFFVIVFTIIGWLVLASIAKFISAIKG